MVQSWLCVGGNAHLSLRRRASDLGGSQGRGWRVEGGGCRRLDGIGQVGTTKESIVHNGGARRSA